MRHICHVQFQILQAKQKCNCQRQKHNSIANRNYLSDNELSFKCPNHDSLKHEGMLQKGGTQQRP